MKTKLNKKAQIRLILVLATIVLLSTIVLAAVALNESNQTNETKKNLSNLELSETNESFIEITPNQVETQEPIEEIDEEPENEITTETSDANEDDVSITICGDNQDYTYNSELDLGWSNDGESLVEHNGGYEESIFTYQAFPRCVTSMEPYEVDMNCLTEYCTEIVRLNQLTGEVKKLWTQGEIW